MFYRSIILELEDWAKSELRKPMILRGARQVGKTTIIKEFSQQFKQFISLNLEIEAHANYFKKHKSIEKLIQAIFFDFDAELNLFPTLIFIDEIQVSPEAVSMLRYFYEEYPQYHIIAAGSLLETIFSNNISFPVGRVVYRVLKPVSFSEFLMANEDKRAVEAFHTIPLPDYAYQKLLDYFHTYALIGGMPEVVDTYIKRGDLNLLKDIYDSILVTYLNDVRKYAKNDAKANVLHHVIENAFREAGDRIKFASFGKSNYGSKEIKEAFQTLQQAMLIQLHYPITQAEIPLSPNYRKSPKLHVLDTGILNYFASRQSEMIEVDDLNSLYKGKITEHLVGQELLSMSFRVLTSLHFWVREKKTSSAEIDYIFQYKGKLYPIEVKSGNSGRMKSLHAYMDLSDATLAIRFYPKEIHLENLVTPLGKSFRLLSLPYFLVNKLPEYIDWTENH